MSFLAGAYNHTVDAKNRIRIPAKLKADMGIDCSGEEEGEQKRFSLVFQPGTDGCIALYTPEAADKLIESLSQVKQSDFEKYRAVRLFLNNFETVESDPQGRMVIPQRFREIGKIKKDIVICGVVDHIEIWAREIYDEYMDKGSSNAMTMNDIVKTLEI